MRGPLEKCVASFLLIFAHAAFYAAALAQNSTARVDLRDDWALQSSCKVSASGRQISSVGFSTVSWHRATVPTTVLAALVADHTYPDPFFADNLRSIPGGDYPLGENFDLLPMPTDSPFRCSWWYRTEFRLPPNFAGRFVVLDFDGINNRANIWLNGKRIATAASVAGSDRTYEFDITAAAHFDAPNALAVKVFAQTPADFGITWIDWNPAPPDKDMGLWRGVYLDASGPVAIRHPMVETHFLAAAPETADLTVEANLHNRSDQKIRGTLRATLEGVQMEQPLTLAPRETRSIHFAPAKFPQLRIRNPKLWWPAQMGEPRLRDASLRFVIDGAVSSSEDFRFGIREITSTLDAQGHRLFLINGRRLMIRGAGWAPDMLLRESSDRLRAQFRYIRDLNLNTIRLEGKLESDEFYDLADEQGVLVMPGWSCCGHWQDTATWTPQDSKIATASLRAQLLRLRNHPSILAWLNGSDEGPSPAVEKSYLAIAKQSDWPNPVLFSASENPSTLTGPTGVKMTGPYDYVPPDFWLTDDGHNGGAAGFNMETSPGPAIPPKSSLEKIFTAADLDPVSPAWLSHTGLGTYSRLDHFNEAMNAIYGPPSGLDDYERKAQAMAYDSERAMFEAYSRNKYSSATGIIQWMLNNAWPSLFWHLYDYYLQPAGGYFGAKKALEPLHIQYSYDDQSIDVVNSTYVPASDLRVRADLYDANMRAQFSREASAQVDADAVTQVMALPADALSTGSPLHYLRLTLTRADGRVASTNFYWLPSEPDVFDWSQASFRYTPVSSYSNLRTLSDLPPSHLQAATNVTASAEGPLVYVKLENSSSQLAFHVRLGICREHTDSEILPVVWSDNYFSLLPGESREITAQFLPSSGALRGADLVVSGWNVSQLRMGITGSHPAQQIR